MIVGECRYGICCVLLYVESVCLLCLCVVCVLMCMCICPAGLNALAALQILRYRGEIVECECLVFGFLKATVRIDPSQHELKEVMCDMRSSLLISVL